MASRDRTALFLRYREEARTLHRRPMPRDDPAHASSTVNHAQDHASDDDPAPTTWRSAAHPEPDWVFEHNALKLDMDELRGALDELAALYARHLLPSFGDHDTSQLERDIRVRSHQLTDLLHAAEQKVRAVSRAQNAADEKGQRESGGQSPEEVIRRNMQKRFAKPLQVLSLDFRKRQKNYMAKLRNMRESAVDAPSDPHHAPLVSLSLHDDDDYHHGDHHDNDGDAADIREGLQMDMMAEGTTAVAEERRRELSRVATSVNDLATLVKDIAALVVDQGTVLDRVDYNLEDVRQHTSGAVRELRLADRYQSKRHALCCIIVLAAGCGLMTVMLIYKWTS